MPGQTLFISYGHKDVVDENWLERLKLHLAPVGRRGLIDIWDDTRIQAGMNWQIEIETALNNAAAAILLVGPGFLASDFVHKKELPVLLAAAANRGTKIYPLVVGYCLYGTSLLKNYQAFNNPEKPLECLSKPEQNKLLRELSSNIDREMLPRATQRKTPKKKHPIGKWQAQRAKEYERTEGFMLAHVYRPSAVPGQAFQIFIFLIRHRKGTAGPPRRAFDEIEKAEFFFGESWGNEVFTVKNTGGLIGVRTDAWGTFLATCRITFKEPKDKTLTLFRYIDFEMLGKNHSTAPSR